jgi:hypothetical protein
LAPTSPDAPGNSPMTTCFAASLVSAAAVAALGLHLAIACRMMPEFREAAVVAPLVKPHGFAPIAVARRP